MTVDVVITYKKFTSVMIYTPRANLLNLFIQLWRDTLRKDTIVFIK
jgi:hypothetical protein